MLLEPVHHLDFFVIYIQKNLEVLPSEKMGPAGYTWSVDELVRNITDTSTPQTRSSLVPRESACRQRRQTLPTIQSAASFQQGVKVMVWPTVLCDDVKLLYHRYPQALTRSARFFPWLAKSVL